MPPRNVPASVRARLRNQAREDQRGFDELLSYFANERFLYRLSQSEHANLFILKGALRLRVWQSPAPFIPNPQLPLSDCSSDTTPWIRPCL